MQTDPDLIGTRNQQNMNHFSNDSPILPTDLALNIVGLHSTVQYVRVGLVQIIVTGTL
jgi:hypothetical protein